MNPIVPSYPHYPQGLGSVSLCVEGIGLSAFQILGGWGFRVWGAGFRVFEGRGWWNQTSILTVAKERRIDVV